MADDLCNLRPDISYVEQLYQKINNNVSDDSKTAVIEHNTGRSVTYHELKQRTKAVASALWKRDFKRGQFLSLHCPNCIENIPIAHGTMATGGTLHLVKPGAPLEELMANIQTVQPRFFVTTHDRVDDVVEAAKIAQFDIESLFVIGEEMWNCPIFEDPGDMHPFGKAQIEPSDIAALVATGGTTGVAKLVVKTAGQLASFLKAGVKLQLPEGFPELKALTFQPFNYSTGIFLAYGIWLSWGTTIISVADHNADNLIQAIDNQRPTHLCLTPAVLASMTKSSYFESADLSSLLFAPCSGAPLPKDSEKFVMKKLKEKAPMFSIFQVYGMTELLTGVCVFPPPDKALPNKEGSVGLPVPSVEVKIVRVEDPDVECGVGEAGEVIVKSKPSPYFKNEERTNKVFKNGWYHTGDYGYRDDDNYFFIIDRVEDLLKVGDEIIAPSSLEDIIRTHNKVKDCIVVGREVETGHLPVAFIIKDDEITTEEIQTYVNERVKPFQQLSGGVRFVEKLPKSPSGKLLRQQLAPLLQ